MFYSTVIGAIEAIGFLALSIVFLRYTQAPGSARWACWDLVGLIALGGAIFCLACLVLTVLSRAGLIR
jgi:hypothetical protein